MNPFNLGEIFRWKDTTSTAVRWVLDKIEGFAPGRAEAFLAWCAADPQHAAAVAKAEDTVALLSELVELKTPLVARLAREAPRTARGWRRASIWTGLAAILAFSAWYLRRSSPEEFNYVSDAARPEQVALVDGSFVNLKSNTVIRAQLLPRQRHVALRQGEAHFAVAHDPSRPFVVDAAGFSIRAVGTAFDVHIVEKGVEVLVLEGRVEISGAGDQETSGATSRLQLSAANRVVISDRRRLLEATVEKVEPSVMREAVNWHSSVTTISSRPLREIVELFNRRNTVRFTIADPELGERKLGGSFAINQPEAFARLLELDGDVISERQGHDVIVLRHKRSS